MYVKTIDPTTDARWDAFVLAHGFSTIFHHSAWARVLKDTYRYSPSYYVVEGEAGDIIAAAPFYRISSWLTGSRLVCLPFSDFCFPLSHRPEDTRLLLSSAKEEVDSGQASHLEIRGWRDTSDPIELGLVGSWCYVVHAATLARDPEECKWRLHHRALRSLKKAQKLGLTVRDNGGEADVADFYRLVVATRKKQGLPPQPYSFFRAIHRHLIEPGHAFLAVAEHEGRIIAGSLFLRFRDTITYKFNASDRSYLQLMPNHLLIWHALQKACSEGYGYLDFGRCAVDNAGLRVFKSQWGTQEGDLCYYYYPAVRGIGAISGSSLKYRAMATVTQRMPDTVLRLAGAAMYRHLG